jgi:hypothetical protein
MGTRGLNVIIVDGQVKVAQYNQWDSYPSGQGATVLDFLTKKMKPNFKEKVLACSWISEEKHKQMWTDLGADPNNDFVSCAIADEFTKRYLHLSRDCGAKIYELIQNSKNGLELQNQLEFAADSLFCEWCYVVDFDKGTFEVYKGFNTTRLAKTERFAYLNKNKRKAGLKKETTYYPVKLVKVYKLDNLPKKKDFLKDLDKEDDE